MNQELRDIACKFGVVLCLGSGIGLLISAACLSNITLAGQDVAEAYLLLRRVSVGCVVLAAILQICVLVAGVWPARWAAGVILILAAMLGWHLVGYGIFR